MLALLLTNLRRSLPLAFPFLCCRETLSLRLGLQTLPLCLLGLFLQPGSDPSLLRLPRLAGTLLRSLSLPLGLLVLGVHLGK